MANPDTQTVDPDETPVPAVGTPDQAELTAETPTHTNKAESLTPDPIAAANISSQRISTRKAIDDSLKEKISTDFKQTPLPDGRIQLETKEGEIYFLEQIKDPDSPSVDSVHVLLLEEFEPQEIEDKDTTRNSLREAQNPKSEGFTTIFSVTDKEGKTVGMINGSYLPPHREANGQLNEGMYFVGYIVVNPDLRKKGLGAILYQSAIQNADEMAAGRNEHLGMIGGEWVKRVERTANQFGVERVYFEKQDGSLEEFRYYYPTQEYNPDTGEPADPEETVSSRSEHMMVRSIPRPGETAGEKTVSAAECLGTAHRIFINYRACWPRERFNSDAAYQRSVDSANEIFAMMETQLKGVTTLKTITKAEREKMKAAGTKFIEHTEPDGIEWGPNAMG